MTLLNLNRIVNSYLSQRLAGLIGEPVENKICSGNIVDEIVARVLNKKFRKWAVSPEQSEQIRRIVEKNIRQGDPIPFTYIFGGYKLWHLPGSPQVDWAEFFALAYYMGYLKQVAAAYPPGCRLCRPTIKL